MLSSITETLFIGKQHFQFSTLPSTNEYALELLSKSAPPEGTAISTPHQYDGRGQIGSKWESEPGKNIALSVILYPVRLAVRDQFQLSIAAALATHDFVAKYIPRQVSIKWPNDIYVNNNKIAGILIQNTIKGSFFQASVVGIGININQLTFSAHLSNVTSLGLETTQVYNVDDLIPVLCQCLEHRYLALKAGHFRAQRDEYLQVLYRYQESGLFQTAAGEVFYGRITGISDTGKLLIEDNSGIRAFDIKEVAFL